MQTELIEALEDRIATYGLLARLFNREVDDELISTLEATPHGDETGPSLADEGFRLMKAYLEIDRSDTITELAVDFARLFLVRTAHERNAPYPFESVYTTDNRTTMGDARDRVLASYREEGIDKSALWTLGEDHIALELEFEQILCQKAVEALAARKGGEARRLLSKQREFLVHHLLSWTPPFIEAMSSTAQTDFYRGLALMLKGFLEEDALYLEALLE